MKSWFVEWYGLYEKNVNMYENKYGIFWGNMYICMFMVCKK